MTLMIDQGQSSSRWYVVWTKAGMEVTAATHLRNQGFEVYLPMTLKMNKMLGRPERKPLFPRYIFVLMSLSADQWRVIFSTIGVKSLVCTAGGNPVPAGDERIANLRVREVNGMISLVEVQPERVFKKGERVKIDDGELEGIFCERVDAKRVRVLLSILGRESRTIVNSARLS